LGIDSGLSSFKSFGSPAPHGSARANHLTYLPSGFTVKKEERNGKRLREKIRRREKCSAKFALQAKSANQINQ
jgi:hypothetical protein